MEIDGSRLDLARSEPRLELREKSQLIGVSHGSAP
jgi:hypothetical protein